MKDIYIEIKNNLIAGKKMVLARIIRLVGSAPRHVGTACLIDETGELTGTIGGGRLEFDVLNRAKTVLKKGRTILMPYQMTGDEVAQSEMLCGGTVDVFLEPLFPENKTVREIFIRLADWVEKGSGGVLISRVADGIAWNDEKSRLLTAPDGNLVGNPPDPTSTLMTIATRYQSAQQAELTRAEKLDDPVFVAPIRAEQVVYLFGAGHISRFVASLAKMVGFCVVVIDDRESFANSDRFPEADRIVVAPFMSSFDELTMHSSAYVVIVTRGHAHDREVLGKALQLPTAYIGMIGSRRKIKIIYDSLKAEGMAQNRLDLVHSPIGLPIGAQTPEEIAVSIVAELIEVRARKMTGKD